MTVDETLAALRDALGNDRVTLRIDAPGYDFPCTDVALVESAALAFAERILDLDAVVADVIAQGGAHPG